MIAEVYPFKRTSRALSAFDYLVPEMLSVRRGMFVEIPYRQSRLVGVVKRVKDHPVRGIALKSISRVREDTALREDELSFFESLSRELFQSTATVLHHAFPQIPKTKETKTASASVPALPLTLPKSDAQTAERLVRLMRERSKAFIQTPDIRRAAALILGYAHSTENQKLLILAPTLRDVELMRSRLAGINPWIITGEESALERFRRWKAFREAPEGVLMGTRTAGLMIDASVTTIFLVRAGESGHKQEDRNPRYDMRELVWNLHESFSANLFCLDVVPRAQTLVRFAASEILSWPAALDERVIDIHKDADRRARTISWEAEQALLSALPRGPVLCVHNQKGSARLIVCRACGVRPTCPHCQTSLSAFTHTLACARCHHKEPLRLSCAQCRSTNLARIGPGNQEVARELKQLFPLATVAIVDKDHPGQGHADILVATSFYLEACYDPFRPERFAAVLLVDVDAPLYNAQPSAIESLTRNLWQWRALAYTSRAPFLVQTTNPALVQTALEDPDALLREDVRSRESYHLPPFTRWYRVTLKEEEPRKAQIALSELKDRLALLPGVIFGATTSRPGADAILELGIPAQGVSALQPVFSSLPDRYIIDTDLFS